MKTGTNAIEKNDFLKKILIAIKRQKEYNVYESGVEDTEFLEQFLDVCVEELRTRMHMKENRYFYCSMKQKRSQGIFFLDSAIFL